jgi:hypothetical protein
MTTKAEVRCEVCARAYSGTGKRYCSRACFHASRVRRGRSLTQEIVDVRFWSRVDRSGDCWTWQGRRLRDGYGALTLHGQHWLAHRFSWQLHYGPIPDGQWVLHHCDVPPCLRPEHLFLGTQPENVRDMDAKGRRRSARGELSPAAKLTRVQVRDIRCRYAEGWISSRALAAQYGVSAVQIRHIASGRARPFDGHLDQ